MLLSAKKYLEDSAKSASSGADQLLTHTRGIISTVKVYDNCNKCNAQVSLLGNLLINQNTCRMCCKTYCSNCIAKSNVNVPHHILDIAFQSKGAAGTAERQYLCIHKCTPRAVSICMQEFRKEITSRFEHYVNVFISDEMRQHFFFHIPRESPEDTAYRKALRMIHMAGIVAGMSGYAMTYNAVKYAYYSSELVNILTEGGVASILTPLLQSLRQCGLEISGPTGMLRLYYLACYHTLLSKIDTSPRKRLYDAKEVGVLYSDCPQAVLDYVSSFLSAAEWMYLSSLPPPHHETDWGSWYLSQIIRRQGWSLLMCINDSSKIPDGSKCPAFALVTRCYQPDFSNERKKKAEEEPQNPHPVQKEAMLVIRGSKSIMDWSINLEDEFIDYSYTHIIAKEKENGDSESKEHYTNTIDGVIHRGIYIAAMGLLEGYNLRSTLLRLLHTGYQVKIVGHSLGAGVASLIAAELRVSLISQNLDVYLDPVRAASSSSSCHTPSSPNDPPTPGRKKVALDSGVRVPSYLISTVSAASAVVFSSPAFMTVNLADAFLEDRILINTVYDKDVVPRFSFKTIEIMARELNDPDFCARADVWTKEDKADFSTYAVNMGKASDIHNLNSTEDATENEAGEMKEKEKGNDIAEGFGANVVLSAHEEALNKSEPAYNISSKPPKPVKPDKIKTMSSVESCSSYCTAEGEDGPWTPTAREAATSGDATQEQPSRQAPVISPTTSTATSSALTAEPSDTANAPKPDRFGSFMRSVSAFQVMASNVVEKLNEANNTHTSGAKSTEPPAPSIDNSSKPIDKAIAANKADKDGQVADQLQKHEQPPPKPEPKPKPHTVTPGPIVHLYKENDGRVYAAVVTHRHTSFQRMEIIPAHSAEDHLMNTVRDGMRSALFQHQLVVKEEEKGGPVVEDTEKFSKYFDFTVNGQYYFNPASGSTINVDFRNDESSLPYSSSGANSPLQAYCSIAVGGNIPSPLSTRSLPIDSEVSDRNLPPHQSNDLRTTSSDGKLFDKNNLHGTMNLTSTTHSPTVGQTLNNGKKSWVHCAVCGLDVTWPYVLHSDASRAIVAHNCRKCGQVVCSLCSPAGDTLPGDGINQSYQLSDYRISLPECGLFSPQRVCLLCYFDS